MRNAQHGTLYCYSEGCRCTDCRKASRESRRDYERRRELNGGRPLTVPKLQRLEELTDKHGPVPVHRPDLGPWLWLGYIRKDGYGQWRVRASSAYKEVYELLIGPVPTSLELDHLCRNRGCVNPTHLEPVPHEEDLRRGDGPSGRNARKTRCPKGHELVPGNLVKRSRVRGRHCLQCARANNLLAVRRYKAKQQANVAAAVKP
jgi:HNH endonuclease